MNRYISSKRILLLNRRDDIVAHGRLLIAVFIGENFAL